MNSYQDPAVWEATKTFYERLEKRSKKQPFIANVLARAKRRHDLAIVVLTDMGEVLSEYRVHSTVKQGNEETKYLSDKQHGSSHMLGLLPSNEHTFKSFRPLR
jgi:hypothetical protein